MKIVLQSNSTSLYLAPGEQWTPRFNDARDFQTLTNLIEFSHKEKLADVQVIIIMEDANGIRFFPLPIERLLTSTAHLHSPTSP